MAKRGPAGPTAKQRKFAKLVGNGTSQAEAYDRVYASHGGQRKNRARAGYALASQPAIRELVKRYEQELLPLGDLRTEQENALSNLKFLAYDSPDHRVRVTASVKLYELLDLHRERLHKYKQLGQPAIPVDAVVSELLELAQSRPAIELETVESENSIDPAQPVTDTLDESE